MPARLMIKFDYSQQRGEPLYYMGLDNEQLCFSGYLKNGFVYDGVFHIAMNADILTSLTQRHYFTVATILFDGSGFYYITDINSANATKKILGHKVRRGFVLLKLGQSKVKTLDALAGDLWKLSIGAKDAKP